MKLIDKVLAVSSKKNRRKGQLKTIALTLLVAVNNSNILTPYPILKEVVGIAEGLLLREIANHAIVTND
jgi:hypothetical protein